MPCILMPNPATFSIFIGACLGLSKDVIGYIFTTEEWVKVSTPVYHYCYLLYRLGENKTLSHTVLIWVTHHVLNHVLTQENFDLLHKTHFCSCTTGNMKCHNFIHILVICAPSCPCSEWSHSIYVFRDIIQKVTDIMAVYAFIHISEACAVRISPVDVA